ncbi:hypothetical protein CCACVL1_08513 [Corchorus capsularis]|uniref:Uncharacterized protein n=1 Tax=Corchorus capsularis TaxID=210143 RepID=A0A1R3J077_COCAP|nr:hypothetical protein CCACVL1_08513 [Corchorus capsularis]
MAMKLKLTLPLVLLIVFLTFTLLVSTPEARKFAPNHLRHAIMEPGSPSGGRQGRIRLDKVFEAIDLLGIKDTGPSPGTVGH